jgi:flagellar biogenesis protein FliO
VNELAFAFRFLAALGVVAGVLVGLRYAGLVLQRARARSGSRFLTVLDTAYLPGGASLHVVRAGERLIVVGRCASSIATLCELGSGFHAGSGDAVREL